MISEENKNSERLEGKVDLFTFSSKLCEDILVEYPGMIFSEDYWIDETTGKDLYCFYNLDYLPLLKFLGNRRDQEFEIRDSRTGNVMQINRIAE